MRLSVWFFGWKGLVLILLLIGGGFLMANHSYRQSRNHIDEAKEHLRLWLVAEGARENLPDVQKIDRSRQSDEENRARLGQLSEATSVRIESLDMRGSWMGSPVFKVEFTVGGKTPPHGGGIRYFEMEYSPVFGWDGMPGESCEFVWNFAPFR